MGLFTEIKNKYTAVKSDFVYNQKVTQQNKETERYAKQKGKEEARAAYDRGATERYINQKEQIKNAELNKLTNPKPKGKKFMEGLNKVADKLNDTGRAVQEQSYKNYKMQREASRRPAKRQRMSSADELRLKRARMNKTINGPQQNPQYDISYGKNDTYDPRYYNDPQSQQQNKISSMFISRNSDGPSNFSSMLNSGNTNKINSMFSSGKSSNSIDKIRHFLR